MNVYHRKVIFSENNFSRYFQSPSKMGDILL